MNQQRSEQMVVFHLLTNPIQTISGINLLNYDKEILNKLYYIISIILADVYLFIYYENVGILFLVTVIAPFFAFINKQMVTSIYYLLFRYVGKIEIHYETLKTVLFPIIALELFLRILICIIFIKYKIIISILMIGIYLLQKYFIFLILVLKLKQSVKKSIILILTLVCFEVILFFLVFLMN